MTLLSYYLAHPAWRGSVVCMYGAWACFTHPSGAVLTLRNAFKGCPTTRHVRKGVARYERRKGIPDTHPLMKAYRDELREASM